MSIIEDLTSLVQCGSNYDCETLKKLLLAEPDCASNMSLCEALKSAVKLDQDGNFPEIDGSLIGDVSSMMDIKLYRDDNVAIGDVLTKEFDIHYEIDSLGSKEEYVK